MEIIMFLYVVGYLIGLGCEIENRMGYGLVTTMIGNLITWPIVIGRGICKR